MPLISPRSLMFSASSNVRLDPEGTKVFRSMIGPPFSHNQASTRRHAIKRKTHDLAL